MIKLIAEIGSNHNNDWNRCQELIKQSKELGFAGIKFQLFKAELLTNDIEKQKVYKEQKLNIDWIPEISKLCKELNLEFGITPFYLEVINECKNYVDYFKISSFDILRLDLIKKCIETKKPVMFSCGLANDENIENIIDLIMQYGSEFSDYYFLHCISKYPTDYKEVCLKRINEIFLILMKYKKRFLMPGYSDHTKDIDVVEQALNLGSQALELHFDLDDGLGKESKYGHCWTPKYIDLFYNRMEKMNEILNKKFEITDEQLKLRANSITGLRN